MTDTFSNNQVLLALKKDLPKTVAPVVIYRHVEEGSTYKTTRHKLTTSVYVDKVKKDQVVLKRDKDAKDSFTESRAKFDQFYHLVVPRVHS